VDVLDYLVTSRARRALLDLLLEGKLEGSVSAVARRARVQPSTAQRELRRMETCGLVSFRRVGREKTVRSGGAAFARALRSMKRPAGRSSEAREAHSQRVRAALTHYGALLFTPKGRVREVLRLEDALADALVLAHEDPAVAGAVPVVLWKNRQVDMGELKRLAVQRGEGQTLGFFLELTDELSQSTQYETAAATLTDKRVRKPRNFFSRDGGFRPYEEELARMTTPEVAKRWHYVMNMSLDSFKSYFRKATEPSVRLAPA
jgi:hypothetical protein